MRRIDDLIEPVVGGCWHHGAPAGGRQWVSLGKPLRLESGALLPDVHLAYETWGTLAPDRSNAVLLLHGLTGDSHVAGPAGAGHPTAGWWDGLVQPEGALSPRRWFLVATNALGGCQGSTGPGSPAPDGRAWGSRFPFLTIRDQVEAEVALADALEIDRWAAVIGGSMGGMRALEWAVSHPDRVESLAVIACSAASTADQIAWSFPQLQAIRDDPGWLGGDYYDAPAERGPWRGLGVARRIAHVTYRSGLEFSLRFGRTPCEREDPTRGGRYAVESYLDHHAAKLIRRFDAGSYVVLTQAMNSHDVGRDRGGVAAALRRYPGRALVVGADTDRLFPLPEQQRLAAGLPGASPVQVLTSRCGHDAFLVELAQLNQILGAFLPRAFRGTPVV